MPLCLPVLVPGAACWQPVHPPFHFFLFRGIATGQPGVSANDLTDERQLDELSGNAALNGVPVKVAAA